MTKINLHDIYKHVEIKCVEILRIFKNSIAKRHYIRENCLSTRRIFLLIVT